MCVVFGLGPLLLPVQQQRQEKNMIAHVGEKHLGLVQLLLRSSVDDINPASTNIYNDTRILRVFVHKVMQDVYQQ